MIEFYSISLMKIYINPNQVACLDTYKNSTVIWLSNKRVYRVKDTIEEVALKLLIYMDRKKND